jgi:L-asparaginase / beta-aspartyl-peptidase
VEPSGTFFRRSSDAPCRSETIYIAIRSIVRREVPNPTRPGSGSDGQLGVMQTTLPAVYVHGGVSGTAKERQSLDAAVRAGAAAARSLDAVQAAVVVLEDDPALNAGYGAVLSRAGTIELDAGIADGDTGRCAGVADVRTRNPVVLARAVLERTPHVLLAGAGADALAGEVGLPQMNETTQEQRDRYERALSEGRLNIETYGAPEFVDTVGAVAVDTRGRPAAASSTGGVFGKLPGRVGDAPVFGAGYYASHGAAVVGTGVGEEFLKNLTCLRVARQIEYGDSPQAACEKAIAGLGQAGGSGTAGLLAIDRGGRVGAAFRGASWSVEGPEGPIEPALVE